MMTENERQQYINCTYIFLDAFCNYKECPRQVLNTLKIASYKFIKDPAVIGFATRLRPIINNLFNHPDLINAFIISPNFPQYRLQKIAIAYNRILAPFATIFNEAFYNSHNGRSCNIQDVLDFLNATNNGIDETFIKKFCVYYDNLSVTEANNFCNRYFRYYPINVEIQEYIKADSKQACGPRFDKFKEIKTAVLSNDDDIDINYVDFDREYASKVIGNIGEYIYADKINRLDKFIHSAKDVGDHLGYDMYFYNTKQHKEDLIEVKATEKKSYYENKDSFSLGSTEYLMLDKYLKNKDFNYTVKRVFINFSNNNLIYYHIVTLTAQNEEVFIDNHGNIYKIGIDDYGNEAYICDGIVRKKTN